MHGNGGPRIRTRLREDARILRNDRYRDRRRYGNCAVLSPGADVGADAGAVEKLERKLRIDFGWRDEQQRSPHAIEVHLRIRQRGRQRIGIGSRGRGSIAQVDAQHADDGSRRNLGGVLPAGQVGPAGGRRKNGAVGQFGR